MPELTAAVRDLEASIQGLRDEVHGERLERRKDRRWLWATIAVIILVGATTMLWNRYSINESQRQWCGVLSVLTDPNPPPTTARGRDSLRELIRLRDSFGCKPMSDPASGK